MKRLTTKMPNGNEYLFNLPSIEDDKAMNEYVDALSIKLGQYEDAEENGLLLRLPCKVGTYIYIINRYWVDEGHICGIAECDDSDVACFKVYEDPDTYTIVAFSEFGETWFLSKEEAEAALQALQKKQEGE